MAPLGDSMHMALQVTFGLAGGLALGLVGGRVAGGCAQTPPAFVMPVVAAAAPAAVPGPVGAPDAVPVPVAVAPAGSAAAAVADPAQADDPVIPARAGIDSAQSVDVSLIPRGKGHFALLDLETAQVAALTIREGSLQRDGAAAYKNYSGNAKVGVLKGPRPRVELLHLGFDAEARPILAHIRTAGHAAGEVEGIVALKQGPVFISLYPAPGADPVPVRPGRAPDAAPTGGEAPEAADAQEPLPL